MPHTSTWRRPCERCHFEVLAPMVVCERCQVRELDALLTARKDAMKSLAQKLAQCTGLLGTADITVWEQEFLTDMAARAKAHGDTVWMSERQADVVERIYKKHFA